MIDAKEAAEISKGYIKELYGDIFSDYRIEEVELDYDDSPTLWLITISYEDSTGGETYQKVFKKRSFKTLKLVASDGEVRAMKNYNPDV